ncbi:MAG: TolC family protein [Ferruginibacter sp.]
MTHIIKIYGIIFFTVIGSLELKAQQMLTVEEAVAAALKNNYEVLLLRNDSAVYALNNSYARAAFLPRVNASSAVIFNNNDIKQKLADGTQRGQSGLRSNNISSSVNLNWTVFDGLKMFATRDKLAEFVKLGELAIKNQLVNTVAEVIITYYNIVRQKQQLKAIEEQMSLNDERRIQAEKKISVGLGAKPELLQAKLDLNAQRAALLTQQNLIERLKEELNQLISFKAGTTYEVADSIPINTGLVAGDIFSYAEVNNTALMVAKQNISIANLSLKERKAERFPVVGVNAAYNFSKTNNQAVVNNFTPLFNRNFGFNYGLNASIPILNGFNVRRQIREAEFDIQYRQLLYDYELSRTQTGISTAFKNYELQKKTLALEEENIILAKENVYISVERLRLGVTTSLELRETQRSLEEAYNRLIAARYNTKVAETQLLKLKGDIIK